MFFLDLRKKLKGNNQQYCVIEQVIKCVVSYYNKFLFIIELTIIKKKLKL